MDTLFEKLAFQIGGGAITGDQLKVVISLLSSYMFAYLYRYLPTKASSTTTIVSSQAANIKHMYSIVIALFNTLIFLKLYTGFLHITVTCISTYILMKYNHSQQGPWINFILVMISMSLCHFARQLKGNAGDATLDYSGMMMIATIKLTMFGFNVYDGRKEKQKKASTTAMSSSSSSSDTQHKDHHQLTEYNQRMKIDVFPTFLEFTGWMFFFGGFLVGPACEYMDYIRFTYQHHQRHHKEGSASPSSVRPTCLILIKSALSIGILLSSSTRYNLPLMLKPEWQASSFVKKLFFIQVVAFVARCKYYTVWLLSEGACVLCGFGFTGYDAQGHAQWDRVTNINIVHCELPQSLKEMSDYWNMGANRWLKHYVYLRVTPRNKKAGVASTLITYTVSALWHGFYPGYYIMFLSLGLYQTIGRIARKIIRPFTLSITGKEVGQPMVVRKAIYDLFGIIVTVFTINTMSVSFIGLYLGPVIQIWKQIYFIHYFLGLLAWMLLKISYRPLVTAQKYRLSKSDHVKIIVSQQVPNAADMDVTDLGGVEPPLPEIRLKKVD